jgi:hypothetical protein
MQGRNIYISNPERISMKKDLFEMLNKAVLDTQADGKNILYFSGKFAGYEYPQSRKAKNIGDLRAILNAILEDMGLGNVESIESSGNKIIIRIRELSQGYFTTGFITGIVSKALDYNFYKFTGREIDCKKKGNICTFEIKSI